MSWKIRARSPLVSSRGARPRRRGRARRRRGRPGRAAVGSGPGRRSRPDGSGQAATTRSRPRALGAVERLVGGLDELLDRLVRPVRDGDADRHADRCRPRTAPRSRPRTAARMRSPTSTATPGSGLRSRTTNSSPPKRAGTSSSRTADDDGARDRPQDLVAGRMAVGVVEDLELVDVDHEDPDGVAGAPALGEQRHELLEVAAVGQPGQGVGRGLGLGGPVRVGPGERRGCLDGGAGQDAPGGLRPRPADAARQDDRADDAVVRRQRRGQGVGQAVDRPDAPGDPVGRLRGVGAGVRRRPGRRGRRPAAASCGWGRPGASSRAAPRGAASRVAAARRRCGRPASPRRAPRRSRRRWRRARRTATAPTGCGRTTRPRTGCAHRAPGPPRRAAGRRRPPRRRATRRNQSSGCVVPPEDARDRDEDDQEEGAGEEPPRPADPSIRRISGTSGSAGWVGSRRE